MLSHILLPGRGKLAVGAVLAVAIAAMLGACGGASPQVNVIGVSSTEDRTPSSEDDDLVVFLEVLNRTGRELKLSRFEYDLRAPPWFEAAGAAPLARSIDADSSAVIEVPIPDGAAGGDLSGDDVAYELEGRLVALEDKTERSWAVDSHGTLRRVEGQVGSVAISVAPARDE